MPCDCLDAGFIGSQLLEKSVIRLKVEHASALAVGHRRTRRWTSRVRINHILLLVGIHILVVGVVEVSVGVVGAVGEGPVDLLIVVVAHDDVGRLLRWTILREDLHLTGLLVEARIHVRLLIGRRKVIVHSIRVVAVVNVR